MHGWVILFFALWVIAAIAVRVRQSVLESRGRKLWREWRCPECDKPFGSDGLLQHWRRKRDSRLHGALTDGPMITCARCSGEFWYTWTGKLLPMESMKRSYEITSFGKP